MKQPYIVKGDKISYPKLMVAKVNENLIILAVDHDKAIVLSSGGSSHKIGEITYVKSHYEDFTGKITLEN